MSGHYCKWVRALPERQDGSKPSCQRVKKDVWLSPKRMLASKAMTELIANELARLTAESQALRARSDQRVAAFTEAMGQLLTTILRTSNALADCEGQRECDDSIARARNTAGRL